MRDGRLIHGEIIIVRHPGAVDAVAGAEGVAQEGDETGQTVGGGTVRSLMNVVFLGVLRLPLLLPPVLSTPQWLLLLLLLLFIDLALLLLLFDRLSRRTLPHSLVQVDCHGDALHGQRHLNGEDHLPVLGIGEE